MNIHRLSRASLNVAWMSRVGEPISCSVKSEAPEQGGTGSNTPSVGLITFNAWVIVSGGGLGGGGEGDILEHENQTFTALDGMTWKEYIDSEYGWYSPFFYYEGVGVFTSDGDEWSPQDFGILLDGILVSENDKIIANAQYDNGARISG